MTGQWTYGHGEGVMAHAGHWAPASQYVQMAEHSLYISQRVCCLTIETDCSTVVTLRVCRNVAEYWAGQIELLNV